jgi:DNA-directed RNA polymerase subunit H
MNKDVPVEVYKNIFAMFGYRGVKTEQIPDMRKFQEDMASQEYTVISGTRDIEINSADGVEIKNIGVVVVQFNENSLKGLKTPAFKKVLQDTTKTLDKGNYELITVTEQPLNTHLRKAVREFTRDARYHIENYSYRKFIIEFPKHELMDKHEIIPSVELDKLLFTLKTQKSKLPKILSHDTAIVWIGARSGQVVRIHRTSETAGTAIVYRMVK